MTDKGIKTIFGFLGYLIFYVLCSMVILWQVFTSALTLVTANELLTKIEAALYATGLIVVEGLLGRWLVLFAKQLKREAEERRQAHIKLDENHLKSKSS